MQQVLREITDLSLAQSREHLRPAEQPIKFQGVSFLPQLLILLLTEIHHVADGLIEQNQ